MPRLSTCRLLKFAQSTPLLVVLVATGGLSLGLAGPQPSLLVRRSPIPVIPSLSNVAQPTFKRGASSTSTSPLHVDGDSESSASWKRWRSGAVERSKKFRRLDLPAMTSSEYAGYRQRKQQAARLEEATFFEPRSFAPIFRPLALRPARDANADVFRYLGHIASRRADEAKHRVDVVRWNLEHSSKRHPERSDWVAQRLHFEEQLGRYRGIAEQHFDQERKWREPVPANSAHAASTHASIAPPSPLTLTPGTTQPGTPRTPPGLSPRG